MSALVKEDPHIDAESIFQRGPGSSEMISGDYFTVRKGDGCGFGAVELDFEIVKFAGAKNIVGNSGGIVGKLRRKKNFLIGKLSRDLPAAFPNGLLYVFSLI